MSVSLDEHIRNLRADARIEKANIMTFADRQEAWVTLRTKFEPERMREVAEKHGCQMFRFGTFPSMLPRLLSELLWSGTAYVIARKVGTVDRLKGILGMEPRGLAKVSKNLFMPNYVFITDNLDGIKILYDYLG